tara:strand:+ start:1847 stop:2062 length:216 start_codon:yes stop_codon:yes gene_type:complete
MGKEATFQWIVKVIRSCNNLKQVDNCRALIESYTEAYSDRTLTELLTKEKNLMLNQVWMDNCPDLKKINWV